MPFQLNKLEIHELNYGQYVEEVQRVVAGKVPVTSYGVYNNEPATPEELLEKIKETFK